MSQHSNATIYFSPQFYSTSGPKLMGANAASESFLKAFVSYSGQSDIYCHVTRQDHIKPFVENVKYYANGEPRQVCVVQNLNHEIMENVGTLYWPACNMEPLFWQRRRYNQRAYSICGVTHTIASHDAIDPLTRLVTSPSQSWDALICTSQTVKESLTVLFENMCDYYSARFGVKVPFPSMQLPLIPLGIDYNAFQVDDKEALRRKWRQKLHIAEDDIVLLFVGRLSLHAKAHPYSMFKSVAEAAKKVNKKIHLVQAGWAPADPVFDIFDKGGDMLPDNVTPIALDGRDMEVRKEIWSCADIFLSLVDNIQESFGLTPLEAMASGLPVIVTDWNGYKDTVVDGECGFRIRTLTPAAGVCQDIVNAFEDNKVNYDFYLANICQAVSCDTAHATEALVTLIEDENLRKTMGENGRKRVQDLYDWKHIIPQYQALWAELAERRKKDPEMAKLEAGQSPNPVYADPFAMFASYPTDILSDTDKVALKAEITVEQMLHIKKMPVNNFGHVAFPGIYEAVFGYVLEHKSATVSDIIKALDAHSDYTIKRVLLWFAKVDLVSIGRHNVGE